MQLLVFVYALVGAVLFYGMPDALDLVVTIAMAIGAIVGMAIMGGKKLIAFDRKAICESFRQGIWYFGTSAAIFLLSIGFSLTDETFVVSDGWPLRLVQTLLLCVGIGVAEEGVFRGLQLGGLLDVLGRTKRGVVVAVLVSSLLFGLAHVDPTTISLAEPITLVQAILKVVQTGEMGFLLATIVLRTGNIMGGAALHAIGDFLIMFTGIVLQGESTEISYVSTGDDALYVAGFYLFVILLYIPMVVRGIRLLRNTKAPHHGAFHRGD